MNITNTSGAQQQTLAPPSLPFNPSAPAFQPKVQSSQESHGALSQPVSTADTGSSQMSLLRDDFSDMRGRFAAFTAPFVQVKMAQTQSLATVSGLSFPEPAHSTHSTPPQFAAPISVGGEPRAAHPAQPRVQAPTRVHTNINTTSLGQTREIPKPPSRTATGTWVNIAEKGALALWTRAEKETAERDPQAWIALARQELDRLQEVYKPGSIPSEVLQAHLTKYASAYTAISEPREKTSVSATAAMPGTEATPTKLTDTRIGEKTRKSHQSQDNNYLTSCSPPSPRSTELGSRHRQPW